MNPDPVSPAELDYIAWAIGEQGHAVVAVAEHLDRNESTIRKHLSRLGIKSRFSGRSRVLAKSQVDEIARLVPTIGCRATAAQLGIDRATVNYHAKRASVTSPYVLGNAAQMATALRSLGYEVIAP
jgi:DNA-binding CsgD family transcriptional regulator